MKKIFGTLALTSLAAGGIAFAAAPAPEKLSVPVARVASEGAVQIDRGNGFETAGSIAIVSAGDAVRLSSAGTLVYGDNCAVQVAALDAFTVAAASPCAQTAMLSQASFVQDAATPSTTQTAGAATSASSASAVAGLSTTAIIGVGVAAAVVVAAVASDSDDDKSISA